MDKVYMGKDAIVELNFVTQTDQYIHFHQNIDLIYLLEGKLEVIIEGENFFLQSNDFIMINRYKKHSYHAEEEVLFAKFLLSYSEMNDWLKTEHILFWCNTVIDRRDAYDKVRVLIQKIFRQFFSNSREDKIYLESLYYQLLYTLITNFIIGPNDIRYIDQVGENNRSQEIMNYINQNFDKEVSLKKLSEYLYLSNAYLSRYIKKELGLSFIELVNRVRLSHALEDLLYSDESVLKIAMKNGFANVASFNKVFKNEYHMTPMDFRADKKSMQGSKEEDKTEKVDVQEKVKEFLSENKNYNEEGEAQVKTISLVKQKDNEAVLQNSWSKLLNIGAASNLLDARFQKHILYLKKNLKIEYVRFWNIYSKEMFLNIQGVNYNFNKIDYILDFLVENEIKVFMEVGQKPMRLLKNIGYALRDEDEFEKFENINEMENFFDALMKHLVQRYGKEEVTKWYFEMWMEEDISFKDLSYAQIKDETMEKVNFCFITFDKMAGAMRNILPNVQVGGLGWNMSDRYPEILNYLKLWKTYQQLPSFISIYGYPYVLSDPSKMSTDTKFLENQIIMIEKALKNSDFPVKTILVPEYSTSLSNRNIMNDTCYKAASLLRILLGSIGKVKMLGYWIGTDLYAEFNDTDKFLFGGGGLLNKSGIPKPAYYAFDFMNRLGQYILQQGEDYIITTNQGNSYRILCHNCMRLNYKFFLKKEDEIKVNEIADMMEENLRKRILFKIQDIRNGQYVVKQWKVNEQFGNILQGWINTDMEENLTEEEAVAVGRFSIPGIVKKKHTVTNQMLEFEIVMEPNEILFLYVSQILT